MCLNLPQRRLADCFVFSFTILNVRVIMFTRVGVELPIKEIKCKLRSVGLFIDENELFPFTHKGAVCREEYLKIHTVHCLSSVVRVLFMVGNHTWPAQATHITLHILN